MGKVLGVLIPYLCINQDGIKSKLQVNFARLYFTFINTCQQFQQSTIMSMNEENKIRNMQTCQ